jgi:hypothetical protein
MLKFWFTNPWDIFNEHEESNFEVAVRTTGPGRIFLKSRLRMIPGRTLLLMIILTKWMNALYSWVY